MDRAAQFLQTFWPRTHFIPLVLVGAGSGKAPTLGEGDPNGTYFAQPVFTSTGIWSITTLDPYPGFMGLTLGVMQATGAGTLTCQVSPNPAQNTTSGTAGTTAYPAYSWTFTFNTFVSGSASDILTGDRLYVHFTMRNSSPGFGTGTNPTD
jgi:hypothetical protein